MVRKKTSSPIAKKHQKARWAWMGKSIYQVTSIITFAVCPVPSSRRLKVMNQT